MIAIRTVSRTCAFSLLQAFPHMPSRIPASIKTHALFLEKGLGRLHSSKASSTAGKEPWIFSYQPEILKRNQTLQNFTPEKMIAAARKEKLEEKIHDYLTSIGNNLELSEGLKKQKRYWLQPIQLSLHLLQRCTGPEKHMEYPQSSMGWDARIADMRADLLKKWLPPPLLCEYRGKGILSIRDGSHRFEALKQVGYKKYWAIVWCNTLEDYYTLHNKMGLTKITELFQETSDIQRLLLLRSSRNHRYRYREFILEGRAALDEASEAGWKIKSLFYPHKKDPSTWVKNYLAEKRFEAA